MKLCLSPAYSITYFLNSPLEWFKYVIQLMRLNLSLSVVVISYLYFAKCRFRDAHKAALLDMRFIHDKERNIIRDTK